MTKRSKPRPKRKPLRNPRVGLRMEAPRLRRILGPDQQSIYRDQPAGGPGLGDERDFELAIAQN